MEITPDVVKRVADNARLKLKEEELRTFAKELQDILTTFQKLSTVNTEGVKPSFHPIPVTNITRKDEPGNCLDRDKALSLTPHVKGNYFKGPKVI